MAFTFEKQGETIFGNKRVVYGTFTNDSGSTGGDINTGLTVCENIVLQHTGTAVVANAPVLNETFPVSGGDVTIVTDADASGIYTAYGY